MKPWHNFEISGDPVATPGSVIQGGNYRFTVLTERLIRLEYSMNGRFLDRATQIVVNRCFPVPDFHVTETSNKLIITTPKLRLTYDKAPFSANGLSVELLSGDTAFHNRWSFGQKPETLGGTARTLDGVNGAIPLEPGLLSQNGWSLIDDSNSMAITDDGWVEPRDGDTDIYFLGYGRDYLGCLRDFFALAGPTPMLPRYALGNWWSRFHRYTDVEYISLMERFREEDTPLSVAVVDMDWHLTEIDPKYGHGWTGWSWNENLFPDYKGFLRKLHEMGLRTSLNIHPADGVRAYENMYPQMAAELGFDPETQEKIPFDAGDAAFMAACFKHIFHLYEDDGVDFWWIDWQHTGGTSVAGLDTLWLLNHCHYMDSAARHERGLTFSRYAGLGSHRYPVGFSGDTHVTWESLDFQPFFTATASNVGYGWWSHDIGGHMGGVRDDELALRWVQFGVFSPITRLHSTWSVFNRKEPWSYGSVAAAGMKAFLRLRHRLAPYLYAMNARCHYQGEPLIQPMYYKAPYANDAYSVPNQYWFGSELIVCPITKPVDKRLAMAVFEGWLPEGTYTDIFNGRIYRGGRKINFYRGLDSIPVLARAGGIVPLAAEGLTDVSENPAVLEVLCFAGSDGAFALYEDNGCSGQALRSAVTTFTLRHSSEAVEITISPEEEAWVALPTERQYNLVMYGIKDSGTVSACLSINPEASVSLTRGYDPVRKAMILTLPPVASSTHIKVTINNLISAENIPAAETFDILHKAQIEHELKTVIYDKIKNSHSNEQLLGELVAMQLEPPLLGALAEVITA